MTDRKPIAAFNLKQKWLQERVLEVAPPEFEVRFPEQGTPGKGWIEIMKDADFLMTCGLRAKHIATLERCKLVQHQGVGHDGIDLDALTEAGIPFAVTPEGTVIGVAEHTILLMLALSKHLVQVHQFVRDGNFNSLAWRPTCHFLNGRTVGILGFGRIGRRAAYLAHAFGVNLLYSDVVRAPEDVEKELDAKYVSLEELLSQSDIVSMHTPLTPETEGMLGAEQFALMKKGALFVNTGRGKTYDMDALYESLKSGHIGAAGLDVFNPEPPPSDHPILQLPNVICTPHMATGTVEAHLRKAQAQFANFQRVLRGEAPINVLNKPKQPLAR